MLTATLWLWAPGCRHPVPPPPADGPDGPDAVTSATASTGSTGSTGATAATGDTGATGGLPGCDALGWPASATDYAIPPFRYPVALAPAVRIVGFPGTNFGWNVGLVPADPGGVGALIADSSGSLVSGFDHPFAFMFHGDTLPRGEVRLCDAWDGVSGYNGGVDSVITPTGDVDGDGHRDVWLNKTLERGPLKRQIYADDGVIDGEIAWLGSHDFWLLDGAYDADGDGYLDVMRARDDQIGELYYGPLEGLIVDADEPGGDPSRWSTFGTGGCQSESYAYAVFMPDLLGLGRPAFSLGKCSFDTTAYLWDLSVPRGSSAAYADALSYVPLYGGGPGSPVSYVGDVDGDGYGDILVGGKDSFGESYVFAGPTSGEIGGQGVGAVPPNREALRTRRGYITHPIGDLNGDGVTEFAGLMDRTYRVLLFSPYTDPLDVSSGMRLAEDGVNLVGAADLDGDGLNELVATTWALDPPTGEELFEVLVWFGAELLAAKEAQ